LGRCPERCAYLGCCPKPRRPRATARCRTLRVTRGGHTCPPWDPPRKRPAQRQSPSLYGPSDAVVVSDAPTHTHAKNITHTQHSPTCCFLCIQGSRGLYSQQSRATMPIVTLHQENFSVLTDFVNESAAFFKVSTFSSNTFFSSTMSLTK
jgi:hypothetical protein